MYTLIYIGALKEGDYEGKHYSYTPCVFADDKGYPTIEKVKDINVVNKSLRNHIGEGFEIYYDRYGKLSMVVPVGKGRA